MTKRHFEWAAAYTAQLHRTADSVDARERAFTVERTFVDLFTAFGVRFDEARFREACKPGGGS